MDNNNTPCSPHLQIYKLPLTACLSILHRITGVVLSAGLVLFAAVLLLITAGPEICTAVQSVAAATPAKIGLVVFLYALFFHWCHGLRHLLMDTGKSLEKATMTRYALLEATLSVLLTAGSAAFIWAG